MKAGGFCAMGGLGHGNLDLLLPTLIIPYLSKVMD